MNQREKEQYLREYAILKNEGKPFFPYAVAKDSVMMVIVMAMIIFLALFLGDQLAPKVDPTTTTYVPRPDWYFFFLFELLRVMRNVPKFTDLATIGVPTICMILLFLLPFYDRSPERRITHRPVALVTGLVTILAMAYLTASGAQVGSPWDVNITPPASLTAAQRQTFIAGEKVMGESGCEACHLIGNNGNDGPGPILTHIGDTLRPNAIAATLRNPNAPMPSFIRLAQQSPKKFNDLVQFLGMLH